MKQVKIFSGEPTVAEGKVNKFLSDLDKKEQKPNIQLTGDSGHCMVMLEYEYFPEENQRNEAMSIDVEPDARNFRIGS